MNDTLPKIPDGYRLLKDWEVITRGYMFLDGGTWRPGYFSTIGQVQGMSGYNTPRIVLKEKNSVDKPKNKTHNPNMIKNKKVVIPKGFRLLKVGEVLKEGDYGTAKDNTFLESLDKGGYMTAEELRRVGEVLTDGHEYNRSNWIRKVESKPKKSKKPKVKYYFCLCNSLVQIYRRNNEGQTYWSPSYKIWVPSRGHKFAKSHFVEITKKQVEIVMTRQDREQKNK